MKKIVVGLAAASLLSWGAAPAQAATVTKVVYGFDYGAAGLLHWNENCSSGAVATPTALYRAGGDLGSHATGLSFGGATGYEGGTLARVTNPRNLQSISFATYHPAGPDADTNADGHFMVRYDPDNNWDNGYHYAYRALDSTVTGWGTWSNFANASLDWWTYNGGSSYTDHPFTGTIAQFATSYGTSTGNAWVGFMFGCNGRDYYMDNFRIQTSTQTTIYDFEGARSLAYLSTYPTHHSTTLSRSVTRLRLVHGQSHYLLGDAAGLSDTVLSTGWIPGTATLMAKKFGSSSFKAVSSLGFAADTYAQFKVRPAKRTVYQVRTRASSTYEAAASHQLVVDVQRRVKARAADDTIRKGQRIKVTGKLFPGDRGVKVVLQRKVSGGWRAIGSNKSGKWGAYAVSARAGSVGKWTIRVLVPAAKGNLGTKSPKMVITVKKPPARPAPPPPSDPVVVYSPPPPPPHEPSDDIKARQLARSRMLVFGQNGETPADAGKPAAASGAAITQRRAD